MTTTCLAAPIWSANAFSEDENEQELSFRQYESYLAFYEDLLPKVDGLLWNSGGCYPCQYVFSRDTKQDGYRVSVFDERGAVRHGAGTITELLHKEDFPYDGRILQTVVL